MKDDKGEIMLVSKEVSNCIRQICEESDEYFQIYEDYSGRFMNGKTCFGIVLLHGNLIAEFFVTLSAKCLNSKENYTEILALAKNMRQDALGLDTIIYFPNYKLS